MKEFAERLKLLRTELNISQNQLSKDLHISQSIISHWESGDKIPKADSLVLLSKYFKCSTDYLLGLED